jgi:hypothetical protein
MFRTTSLALLAGLMLCAACNPSEGEWEVGRDDKSLNSIDAELELAIRARHCEGSVPLRLCLGSRSNCYPIPAGCRNTNGCFSTSTLKTCTVATSLAGEDHPFVNHPDDWDHIFFATDVSSLRLYEARVSFRYGGHGNPLTVQHDFVDQAFSPSRYASTGQHLSLDREIRERRIQAVETLSGLSYEELPWMVRQAALDLGQAGLVKYRPWDTSLQNGCDEFYNHFAAQFSNNIHLSSRYFQASFFDGFSTDNHHNSLALSQFINANRAAKMLFNHNAAGDRVSIDGIYYCTNADCSTVDRRRRFAPNASSLLLKKNHPSVGNFHAMMMLGPIRDQSGGGSVAFDVDIIHKSSIVRANTWNIDHAYINRQVTGGGFRHEFYFGSADHGARLPVNGGVETGAWRLGPNAGFRATLVALY